MVETGVNLEKQIYSILNDMSASPLASNSPSSKLLGVLENKLVLLALQ